MQELLRRPAMRNANRRLRRAARGARADPRLSLVEPPAASTDGARAGRLRRGDGARRGRGRGGGSERSAGGRSDPEARRRRARSSGGVLATGLIFSASPRSSGARAPHRSPGTALGSTGNDERHGWVTWRRVGYMAMACEGKNERTLVMSLSSGGSRPATTRPPSVARSSVAVPPSRRRPPSAVDGRPGRARG